MLITKHLQQKSFNRSSLVSGAVEFSARKLIYFVLLQLVLSSFVLITADTLNGSQNTDNTNTSNSKTEFAQPSSYKPPELTPLPHSPSRFGCSANTITDRITWNGTKLKCTGDDVGDGVLTSELAFNKMKRNTTNENLIQWHNDGGVGSGSDGDGDSDSVVSHANAQRPNDDNNLSLTGNASIRNQSQQTGNSLKQRHRRHRRRRRHEPTDGRFNKDGERVLSRKRR